MRHLRSSVSCECYGRVEVYYSWQWGTVCDDDWDITDANEVCCQLGFSRASGASLTAKFGEGSGTITSAVKDERHCCYSVPMM